MSNFNSLENAFEKAGIRTETKGEISIFQKKLEAVPKGVTLLFKKKHHNMNTNYLPSERSALSHGFVEIADDNAYNGRYFIKNEKIWIHDIGALKSKLDVVLDRELRIRGYDVETYYKLDQHCKSSRYDCVASSSRSGSGSHGENMVYLSDGVYIRESACWF